MSSPPVLGMDTLSSGVTNLYIHGYDFFVFHKGIVKGGGGGERERNRGDTRKSDIEILSMTRSEDQNQKRAFRPEGFREG